MTHDELVEKVAGWLFAFYHQSDSPPERAWLAIEGGRRQWYMGKARELLTLFQPMFEKIDELARQIENCLPSSKMVEIPTHVNLAGHIRSLLPPPEPAPKPALRERIEAVMLKWESCDIRHDEALNDIMAEIGGDGDE